MVTKNIPPSLTEILLLSAKSYNWNVGFLEVSCKVYAATVDICGGVGLVRRIFVANGGGIVKKPIVRIGCIFHVHNPVGPGCTGRQPKNRHNDREAKILSKERTLKEMGSKRSAQAFFCYIHRYEKSMLYNQRWFLKRWKVKIQLQMIKHFGNENITQRSPCFTISTLLHKDVVKYFCSKYFGFNHAFNLTCLVQTVYVITRNIAIFYINFFEIFVQWNHKI